jgi:uncharacterized membrane protein
MALSEKEQQQINTLVGRFEADTGIQAVAAVIERADAYPELPWKGYAIGSALGALAVVLYPHPFTDWSAASTLAFHAMAILGVGALVAAATLVPALGRVLLDRVRAEGEARQRAAAMFLEREIFRTAARRAVLLLVSRFERVTVVLRDTGLAQYTSPQGLEHVAASMRAALSRGEAAAFEAGFQELRALLSTHGYVAAAAGSNELDDGVVMERGA